MAADSKRTVVIDASAVLCVLLGDEQIPSKIRSSLDDYAKNNLDLVAPTLLKTEVGNALKSATLQKRMTANTAASLYEKFLELPIKYLAEINFLKILKVSLDKKLSFYDATYLHLAQSLKLELLALDNKLNRAS